jgi:biopolymer transport protein ExbD
MKQRSFMLEPSGGFPMTPMIDIVLQLLIFFMLISRYLPPTLNVELPQASSAVAQDRPALSIAIDAEGRLSVDGRDTVWDGLSAMLAGRDPETVVRISADRQVDYAYVVRALDAAAQASLPHVALEMQPEGQPASSGS